jgi:hypothetical protein
MEYHVKGITNPVRAAEFYIRSSGESIDQPSFEVTSFQVGDVDTEDGFVIDGIDKLYKLAQIGGFSLSRHPDGRYYIAKLD